MVAKKKAEHEAHPKADSNNPHEQIKLRVRQMIIDARKLRMDPKELLEQVLEEMKD